MPRIVLPRVVARSSAAIVLSVAATAAWISPAAQAASARPVTASPTAIKGSLDAVAASSASNAWAVGFSGSSSLTLHWNGHAWARVPAPGGGLIAVAVSSPDNAWAVGENAIVHWNGHTWKRTPAPAGKASLSGVSTTSPSNAWVVGENGTTSARTLTLHWNGHSWKRVASPDPHPFRNTGDLLMGVKALSARNAWAVGAVTSNVAGPQRGLILHWNGRKWSQVSATAVTKPASGGLRSITATSASNVWAAGCDCAGGPDGGVIGHWNGRGWAHQNTPFQRKFGTVIDAVSASSRSSAFAVGSYCKSGCTTKPFYTELILRWTGSAWKTAATPTGHNVSLLGVATVSASNAWAVGQTLNGTVLIQHWNGHSWQASAS